MLLMKLDAIAHSLVCLCNHLDYSKALILFGTIEKVNYRFQDTYFFKDEYRALRENYYNSDKIKVY